MAHLRPDDWITNTHRGHGHALAKGVPARLLLAELAGKATGSNGGRGGTMHVFYSPAGLFGTNGLVAGGIPSAVGLAIAAKTRGTGQISAAFFGDGGTTSWMPFGDGFRQPMTWQFGKDYVPEL
jgi:TPP-dependent pyruvate/acetoin dehydrogenase alpha subunit